MCSVPLVHMVAICLHSYILSDFIGIRMVSLLLHNSGRLHMIQAQNDYILIEHQLKDTKSQ